MTTRTARANWVGVRAGLAATLLVALLTLAWQAPEGGAQPDKPRTKLGLIVNEPGACRGYTLIAGMGSHDTYLIDMQGRVVQTWKSDCGPAASAYLLENGNLLRTGQMKNPPFKGAAFGGRIQQFGRDGKLVWDFTYANDKQMPHHDICSLPNGNVLMVVSDRRTAKEAIAAGRRPETVKGHLLSDSILEVKPTGKTTGEVVWEWHAWDHLVQEFDKTKAHFADVGKHPQRIDVNFGERTIASMLAKPEELKKLQALGYVGGTDRKPQPISADWLHINAISYNPELDQIILSVHEFSEIWVIDHSTTKKEAAGENGGKSGKGGGLLYRWGNPRAYRGGTVKDQKLFSQHNAHWIPKGLPGAGHILVFNNGMRRTGGAHSTVDEIVPPLQEKNGYKLEPGKAYGPEQPTWSYAAPKRTDFYSPLISGAQRLSNGNTLICSGNNGTVFEVTPKKEIVWKYVNPVMGGPGRGGPFPGKGKDKGKFGPPPAGQLVPVFLRDMLECTEDQKKDLDALDKQTRGKIEKMLTEEQKKTLKEPPDFFRPGAFPRPGQVLPDAVVEGLTLTDKQKKQLAEIQKDADARLEKIFKDDQKKRFKEMRESKGPPFGGFGPGKDKGKDKGKGKGGPGMFGPGGFGPPGGGSLFRAPRYEAKYPGLPTDLTPGKLLEDLQPRAPGKEPKDKK